jgi:hypothetical protein
MGMWGESKDGAAPAVQDEAASPGRSHLDFSSAKHKEKS